MIKGSARTALEEDSPSDIGTNSIAQLVEAMDTYFKRPERAVDGPFKMAIEDVFSISGRGTVVTGTIESGRLKVGTEVTTVGGCKLRHKNEVKNFFFLFTQNIIFLDTAIPEVKSTVIGVESFNKSVDVAEAGKKMFILEIVL